MEYKKNEDGTDMLDENGQPIPVAITDETEKESAKVIGNLVEELKESRLKLGIAEGLLKAQAENIPEGEPEPLTDEKKLELAIAKELAKRDASNAENNKKLAFEKFITDNKEFHPDNDPTGFKRTALQDKFNRFNTQGLISIDEFTTVIGDAKKLLLGNDIPIDTSKGKPLNSFPTPGNNPSGKKDEELTPKELKLSQMAGNTKEKIIKLKLKNPEYLETLLKFVRD